jgi:hypothetical protein
LNDKWPCCSLLEMCAKFRPSLMFLKSEPCCNPINWLFTCNHTFHIIFEAIRLMIQWILRQQDHISLSTCILRVRIAQYHLITHIWFIFLHKLLHRVHNWHCNFSFCVLGLHRIALSPNSKQPPPSNNLVSPSLDLHSCFRNQIN